MFTEHHWNMWIPGFGSDEVRPYKKSATTEAHKQVELKNSKQIMSGEYILTSYGVYMPF